MPANLPPDARKKWSEVEATHNPNEKLRLMEEFLGLVPQHKGTMKLRGQVKKKMATIRREIEEKKQKRAGRSGPKIFLEKEGAAQIALIGLTSVGKSSLLTAATNAKVEISPSPYTTKEPTPGILNYEDVQFQIIEAPALMEGAAEGRAWGLQTLGIARNSDGLIIMVDLSRDALEQLTTILNELEKARILVVKPRGRAEIERKHMGVGLRIILLGKLADCSMKDVEELLRSYKVGDAVVKISGEVTLNDIEDAVFENTTYKTAVIVANKVDQPGSESALQELKSYIKDKIPIVVASSKEQTGLERLGETLFNALNIIRVYTKEPNQRQHSRKPFTLKRGSTVQDLAKNIHSDFKERFDFAKVWGKRLVFSPQRVGPTFALEDGDIVELHTK